MTNCRRIRFCLFLGALLCGHALAAPAVESATPPELYSFADVYRLTVSGALTAPLPPMGLGGGSASAGASGPSLQAVLAESAPLRPVATAPMRSEEARFLIGQRRPSEGWLMVLAGFVLAGWVAARRLT